MNRTWGLTDVIILATFIIVLLHWLGVNPG
ncbi:hypothetical protein HOU95_gp005 [Streptomyces phage Hiyaa]|jgi:hypothetical protein|uniref:Uncharacterized protein n=1 Tax=Streptomyces phage Hiyaa TaxID=2499072 RepID=A0A3S9U8K8_9CAUD|nr:hypothetical protein HOU95_gp005 [Streptomyces phage Hiyaa]AZS06645.1 hypothetical protein SEA_HIYAA_5 [Streptomyces phage Hiyaa]QNJ57611.1 membrane protein [Streptomyces phage Keanu]